ncbi:hypothetical protein SAMN00808754_1451 [Thermanaeromonas toyohensis ToBE]|uniref:Uncharacterized protein n=1 Tax=Thermanaeromonas toyohensis ToBE TaxID=698762 RepID=A0A1W1VT90_9FIRM|nr:hypothetical protein [Thermanaeromonas toyohensis]SMB96321.1 hypothetical protein SAMN00808754_1451 [Thermanaeromonas toyohensis ToBE]
MTPEKRELVLAVVLGLAAGPAYLLAGPGKFFAWYAAVLGGGMLATVHWLKDIRPSRIAWLTWLAWLFVLFASAVLALAAAWVVAFSMHGWD